MARTISNVTFSTPKKDQTIPTGPEKAHGYNLKRQTATNQGLLKPWRKTKPSQPVHKQLNEEQKQQRELQK